MPTSSSAQSSSPDGEQAQDAGAVSSADKARPWWRYPIVWLVIGGPLVVVIASIITAGIAVRNVDPVLDTSANQVSAPSEAPAVKARNHAADPTPLTDAKP